MKNKEKFKKKEIKIISKKNKIKFNLSKKEHKLIENEIKYYEDPRSVSIEALKIVQKYRQWVPDGAINAISKLLNISISDVEEVATFYSNIFRKPVGKNIIRYCDSVVCYINGYQKIHCSIVKKLNIKSGETTLDGVFTLLPTCCLGNCDKGPVIMINDDTYVHVNSKNINFILENYR